MSYDYEKMISQLNKIKDIYDITECFSIGKSVMGREISCVKIGRGKKKIFAAGAYHGLEYLTAAFLSRFIFEYAGAVDKDIDYLGYDVKKFYESVTLFAVPMVNPDGVDIAVNGLDITNEYHRRLIESVGIHDFSRVWQANARGVDINHNFDANWQSVFSKPSPSKYGGREAVSEPETEAVVNFVRETGFDVMLAFHSQGGEIYYDFDGMSGMRSVEMAQRMADESGYVMCSPAGTASFGGCKDWFIKEFGREGFTIEMGHGKNPLPINMLDDIYEENARIILCAMDSMSE